MTDHTDPPEQSFELNPNNYGPEDVEKLNDWAIKAYAALETLQTEVTRIAGCLERANAQTEEFERKWYLVCDERDAALARLAEIERQERIGVVSETWARWPDKGNVVVVDWVKDTPPIGASIYAAAGASPVEPNQAQPPAQCDTAITYMTGYSDAKEWAQTSQAVVVKPVYQYQLANGNWIDETKDSYDYDVKHGQATVRMLYATPQAAPLYAKEQQ